MRGNDLPAFPERSELPPKRRWGIWAALIVVIATAVGTYAFIRWSGPTVFEKPGFRFTALSCGQSVEVPKITGPKGIEMPGTPAEGIRSRAWRDDGTLFLEAVLIENCGTPPREGDYTINGNTIALSYRLEAPPVYKLDGKIVPMLAACNCPYRLTYELSGIPRADYHVDFPATGKQVP